MSAMVNAYKTLIAGIVLCVSGSTSMIAGTLVKMDGAMKIALPVASVTIPKIVLIVQKNVNLDARHVVNVMKLLRKRLKMRM